MTYYLIIINIIIVLINNNYIIVDINNIYKEYLNKYINIINKCKYKFNKNNITIPKIFDNYTEDEKGYYLSGLFEGDGNIYLRSITIVFSIEDALLADYLCKYFNIGYIDYKINNIKKLTAVRWIILNKEDQIKFIKLINGKLLTNKRYDQFIKYKFDKLINIIKPCEFDILTNPWLTGFTDSDGYFYVGLQLNKYSLSLKFHLELSQKDIYILNIIKKYFKLGNILKKHHNNLINSYNYKAQSHIQLKPFINYYNIYKPLSNRRYRQFLLINIIYELRINNLQKYDDIIKIVKDLLPLYNVKLISIIIKKQQLINANNIINYYRKIRGLNIKDFS